MKYAHVMMLLVVALTAIFTPTVSYAADPALEETRYCGSPKRDSNGRIIRRADVLRTFQLIHPCPSTGLTTGACEGWAKNHIIPLACGGCDSVSNLQWLPNALKSGTGMDVDRWERKVYAHNPPFEDTDSCVNTIVTLPATN